MGKWHNPLHNFSLKWKQSETSSCWEWIAAKDKDGYGVFMLGQVKNAAHRAAWKLYKGEIPVGVKVLHTCNNTGCVNPEYLYLGTQKQNIQDQINAGTFVYGSKNGMAKLSEEQVYEIRASKEHYRDIAKQYNVSHHTIWDILKGRKWKHVK